MKRRELIVKLGVISGTAFFATSGLLNGCNLIDLKRSALTEKDIPLMDEIGETIIPTTATSPGARAAKIGVYMLAMVNDCYNDKQRKVFIKGLNSFDTICLQQYKSSFLELDPINKKKFLIQLDGEAKIVSANKNSGTEKSEHYFSMLKKLTISGYFTSKIGANQALRYEAVPGKFEGCIAYKKGDKPWATN
ncbi:MAG: gluconate 2-dehydrogenase subunit 3 family protein [Pedobacter sp.]|nr:gluconate 2-dehydrogenase subunit 3 family protein [Chitinophagaceae bacterium]